MRWFRRNAALQAPPGIIPAGLQGPAQQQFLIALAEFSDDVYEEAQRLEAAQNTTGGLQEVTGAMIVSATKRIREPYGVRRREPIDLILYAIGALAALALGIAANQLEKSWAPITCILLAPVAIGCGLISYMRGQ